MTLIKPLPRVLLRRPSWKWRALNRSYILTPGMPAEVFILTGEQSLFSYIAAPVTRSFRKAFRKE